MFNYSGHLWWDRVKVYRRICSSFSSILYFFFKSSFCNWLRAHAIFSDRHYPQSNFFCQPGVVALAGSLSCYRKSNILNYLIGNVAGKYLVKYNLSVMSLASIVVLYTLTMLPTAHSDRGKPTLKIWPTISKRVGPRSSFLKNWIS